MCTQPPWTMDPEPYQLLVAWGAGRSSCCITHRCQQSQTRASCSLAFHLCCIPCVPTARTTRTSDMYHAYLPYVPCVPFVRTYVPYVRALRTSPCQLSLVPPRSKPTETMLFIILKNSQWNTLKHTHKLRHSFWMFLAFFGRGTSSSRKQPPLCNTYSISGWTSLMSFKHVQ